MVHKEIFGHHRWVNRMVSSHIQRSFSAIGRRTKIVIVISILIVSAVGVYFIFSLLIRPPTPRAVRGSISLNGEWKYVVASNLTGTQEGYYHIDYNDSSWQSVDVPWEYASTVDNCTVWFRRRFSLPTEFNQSIIRLKFDGVYLISSVWVNGKFLGNHTGYFDPFYFNITDYLNFDDENVLTVFVYSPVEEDLDWSRQPWGGYKIHVEGVFSDWNNRPYPSAVKDTLNETTYGKWFVPGGIWGNVSLIATGPVTLDRVLSFSQIYDEPLANVGFNVTLRNYSNELKDVLVNVSVTGYNFELTDTILKDSIIQLPAYSNRTILVSVDINDPKLWWPWDQGEPNLYQANITAISQKQVSDVYSMKFGIREVHADIQKGQWTWFINGRKFFPRGNNYISNYFLINSNRDWLRHDLELAKEANMDMLRVHAHVEPLTFYDLADEMGILIMQDFPLHWTYADNPYVNATARTQLKQMITMLFNHPSIVLWAMHNEPPWNSGWMGAAFSMRVNYDLDHQLQSIAEALDKTRPSIVASGYEDDHVYWGWYVGNWLKYKDSTYGFPTEIGAQALPNITSPFWTKNINITSWPINPWDERLLYRDYQPSWTQNYLGPLSNYPDLETYIRVSQGYQSALLKLAIEMSRIRKYSPTGGCVIFHFTDCHPAITNSIVDYYRMPKLAYYTVKNAFNPVHVCIDWRGTYGTTGIYNITYPAGGNFAADLYLVNDYPDAFQNVTLTWQIVAQNGTILYGRSLSLDTPGGEDPALKVAPINWAVPAAIRETYTLKTALTAQDGETLDTNSFTFISR